MMACCSLVDACFTSSTLSYSSSKNAFPKNLLQHDSIGILCKRKPLNAFPKNLLQHDSIAVPLSASLALLLYLSPAANAGLLSGSTGLESVPGPDLPNIEFLSKFNEENQKRYAENDARFKDSPVLKELLEKSKINKEKNKQAILDKYCLRGAEWGVGDCSTDGMRPDERDEFIAMLKKKAGIE